MEFINVLETINNSTYGINTETRVDIKSDSDIKTDSSTGSYDKITLLQDTNELLRNESLGFGYEEATRIGGKHSKTYKRKHNKSIKNSKRKHSKTYKRNHKKSIKKSKRKHSKTIKRKHKKSIKRKHKKSIKRKHSKTIKH